jgi:hypothetical protein
MNKQNKSINIALDRNNGDNERICHMRYHDLLYVSISKSKHYKECMVRELKDKLRYGRKIEEGETLRDWAASIEPIENT